MLPKMLDDMLKLFLDPVFKPKHVNDPDRENLYELIYDNQKINQRREYNWDDLYLTKEAQDEFKDHRFSNNRDRLAKLRNVRSNNRTPKKEREHHKSASVRDDPSVVKSISKGDHVNLYSAYVFNKNKPKVERYENSKKFLDHNLIDLNLQKTETRLPKIRNASEEKLPMKFVTKQMSHQPQYVYLFDLLVKFQMKIRKKSRVTL